MKKFSISLILSAFLIIFMCGVIPAGRANAAEEITVSAQSAYVFDYESGTVIYAKNEKQKLSIASMTKIMLLDLAFEKVEAGELSLDEDITVSANASGMGGSQVFLETGGVYKAGELIKSIIVASANDASVAVAERLYGSEQGAVDEMNRKAEKLGLKNTLFSNCTGLIKPTQYSTAEDVAKMLASLIRHDDYFKYSKIYLDEIEHNGGRKTTITNTNKLVRFYNGCDGGKTGYTSESGFCLAATAKRGALRLIAVVIKEADGKTRFKDVSSCFDYGFANYSAKTVLDKDVPAEVKVKVTGGKIATAKIKPQKSLCVFGRKNQKDDIKIEFTPNQKIKAPLYEGDEVGRFTVYKDGVKFGEVAAVSAQNIAEKTYFDYIADITKG